MQWHSYEIMLEIIPIACKTKKEILKQLIYVYCNLRHEIFEELSNQSIRVLVIFALNIKCSDTRNSLLIFLIFLFSLKTRITRKFSARELLVFYSILIKYDLGKKYYALQVRPDQGSNSWPPDYDSTFHVTETPALTTWLSVTSYTKWKYLNIKAS